MTHSRLSLCLYRDQHVSKMEGPVQRLMAGTLELTDQIQILLCCLLNFPKVMQQEILPRFSYL